LSESSKAQLVLQGKVSWEMGMKTRQVRAVSQEDWECSVACPGQYWLQRQGSGSDAVQGSHSKSAVTRQVQVQARKCS